MKSTRTLHAHREQISAKLSDNIEILILPSHPTLAMTIGLSDLGIPDFVAWGIKPEPVTDLFRLLVTYLLGETVPHTICDITAREVPTLPHFKNITPLIAPWTQEPVILRPTRYEGFLYTEVLTVHTPHTRLPHAQA